MNKLFFVPESVAIWCPWKVSRVMGRVTKQLTTTPDMADQYALAWKNEGLASVPNSGSLLATLSLLPRFEHLLFFPEVGWTFVRPHSKDFFAKDGKCNNHDLAQNTSAFCFASRGLHVCVDVVHVLLSPQVLFGVLSVSPRTRVSEDTLSKALRVYLELVGMVPAVGIGEAAIEQWCDKMAFGTKKLVCRFKKLWSETPTAAKSKALDALKKRLNDGIASEASLGSSASSALSLGGGDSASFLESDAFEWGKLEAALLQAEQDNVSTAPPTSASKSSGSATPVVVDVETSPEKAQKVNPENSSKMRSSELEMPPWVLG